MTKKVYHYAAFFILLIFLSVNCASAQQNNQPSKHALIIAISNYTGKGWKERSPLSSDNDAALVKTALEKSGFEDKNITIISDNQCTKSGILAAINKLKDALNPGDVAVIHYSGHGVQIEDDNPKRSSDLAECWVTVDADIPAGFPTPDNPDDFKKIEAKYLKGSDIQQALDDIRTKLGKSGDLLVMVDACCSSGSTSRGIQPKVRNRGLEEPIISSDFAKNKTNSQSPEKLFADFTKVSHSNSMCDYVVIAAARPQESDGEITVADTGYGPLSYAFTTSLTTFAASKKETITYNGLFASIKLIMNEKVHNQMPEIEGSGIDRGVFGGTYSGAPSYFTIASNNGKGLLKIDGGRIQRITPGSKIAFYKGADISNLKSAAKLAEGVVNKAGLFSSEVKIKDTQVDLTRAVAIVSEYNTANLEQITLWVKNNPGALQKLKTHFKNSEIAVTFSDTADMVLEKEPTQPEGPSVLWAMKLHGLPFRDNISLADDKAMNGVDSAVVAYAQYKFLAGLTCNNPNLSARVELITSKNDKVDFDDLSKSQKAEPRSIDTGSWVAFKVVNTCDDPVYVNIVDMSPNGDMATFLPFSAPGSPSNYPVSKCQITPGDSILYFNHAPVQVNPPFGNEILKVFVTSGQLDLSKVILTRGADTRSISNTLGRLFQKSYSAGTRGFAPPPATLEDGTIYGKVFEISDPAAKKVVASAHY